MATINIIVCLLLNADFRKHELNRQTSVKLESFFFIEQSFIVVVVFEECCDREN